MTTLSSAFSTPLLLWQILLLIELIAKVFVIYKVLNFAAFSRVEKFVWVVFVLFIPVLGSLITYAYLFKKKQEKIEQAA
ncbi:hypothetical protein [Sphingobacterium humi]|uniref:Cardiolipin synthase N-terminal domain-containing protein n=1 Tax=Sphingobacterium humi TaxID=1796905 RepID=A0A6N8KWI0_9SPHI|nr:hypothetical protein [Sphingobacterium humi]MVZ61457.1 hypothetical protein [Sphingobacterium humi]